ncbi:toprim domain-containing protein [Sphingobacterium sp. BN32]|uniref:toprim domain-containing protein n=1 Tax=Sphingobacterium sp. BN32 TaxID=3058432 RepID=UPI00265D2F02|nr:toprim domain-containing protein [Sphingobacterium sp. BN32]WKK60365.1 toprim domain-containing protein [Sphingobacterium sp. BN32]
MTCEDLKRIPLISILQHLQIPCAKMNSREAWFKNPFNGGDERTASTKVDVHQNIWYSHSEGIGGNNIDFLMKFLGTSELAKVLEWADERKNFFSFQQQTVSNSWHAVQTEKETGYTILSVKPLKNKALLDYLSNERKIDPDIAKAFCKEIYYRTANGQTYFAVCSVNDSGGFELRNPYDKRSLMTKDITTVDNGSNGVILFEGFIDWLSFLTLRKIADRPFPCTDYCILNTTAHLKRSFPFLERHKTIVSYLDTDESGTKAYRDLEIRFGKTHSLKNGIQELQHRNSTIKDVNDYLVHGLSDTKIENRPTGRKLSNR